MGERLRKMRRELLENGCYQCHSEHWVFILLLFAFRFYFFFSKNPGFLVMQPVSLSVSLPVLGLSRAFSAQNQVSE